MSLLGDPEILLMDEPLAALDPQTTQMLQNIIVKLQTEYNLTIIITDHQARDLLAVCDKAIILSNSKIVAEGTPNQLIQNEMQLSIILVLILNLNNSKSYCEKFIIINKKLNHFQKNIKVSGDKSLSIRFVILSSLAHESTQNILKSEDVISAIRCIRKLGRKTNMK